MKKPNNQNHYPSHIGIILDGNRRWAKENNLPVWEGHEVGFRKVKDLFRWTKELKIKEVTIYCFSMQNFTRSPYELYHLMRIFERALREAASDPEVHQNQIRINVIGKIHLMPKKVRRAVKLAVETTKHYSRIVINFALAYGGREEIVEAIKKIAQKVKDRVIDITHITEETLKKFLWLPSEPDLIIRTGGEQRISNFLIWQAHYSEWFFIKKYWPAFERSDLVAIIDEYLERQRRYGR